MIILIVCFCSGVRTLHLLVMGHSIPTSLSLKVPKGFKGWPLGALMDGPEGALVAHHEGCAKYDQSNADGIATRAPVKAPTSGT